jgi:hypothetical protein
MVAGSHEGLLLPGTFIDPDLFRQPAEARQFVRAFDAASKPVAALWPRVTVPYSRSREALLALSA